MTDIRRFGDSGIHTVEGMVAGERAAKYAKEREIEQQKYESLKNKIKENNSTKLGRIDDKFSSGNDNVEDEFRNRTIGLITAQEFRQARENVNQINNQRKQLEEEKQEELQELKLQIKKHNQELKRKKMKASLSFLSQDEEEEEEKEDNEEEIGETTAQLKKKKLKITKNPHVDTSHLPDRERDARLQEERARLTQEWLEQQEIIKNQMVEVVYSFWDGIGHRKAIEVKKGCTIGQFLSYTKIQLSEEFPELRNLSPEDLLYVKEDMIIPQHITFYDLIITRARGKSGPLFHFDVHDDVRLLQDVRIEKDESHPGKVLERRWYERNKHIFPASRWEVYDPNINREGKGYTIHGDELRKQK